MKGILRVSLTPFRQGYEEQILYSALTYRRLLDSLAHPGKLNQLEYPAFLGEPPCYYANSTAIPLNFYALGAFSTLLDGETSFALAANGRWLDASATSIQWLALRSGAGIEASHSADFAFFCDGRSGDLLSELQVGTLLEPEMSATAFYCIEELAGPGSDDASAIGGYSIKLQLSGPGIREQRILSVSGLGLETARFMQARRKNYPLGIDIYLVDVTGRCIGLPRTTKIEIME